MKRKKPSNGDIRSAKSILQQMSEGEKQVHVIVIINPLVLMFKSALEKRSLGYFLTRPDLEIGVIPEQCDLIMFHPDGGLMLSREGVAVLLDTEERSAQELLDRYPSVAKWVQ